MDDAKIREVLRNRLPGYEIASDEDGSPELSEDGGLVESRAGRAKLWDKSKANAKAPRMLKRDTAELLKKFAKRGL
jgi:hypothetical protein